MKTFKERQKEVSRNYRKTLIRFWMGGGIDYTPVKKQKLKLYEYINK